MIYFIYGEDSFRSQQYLLEVRDFYYEPKANNKVLRVKRAGSYNKDKNPSFFSYDFSDKVSSLPDISVLENIFKSNTLFAGSRLVIIKNLFKNTDIQFRNNLLEILKKQKADKVKDMMIIFYECSQIPVSSLQKWLKQKARGEKAFPLLKKKELEQWMIKEEQKLGLRLAPEARQMILLSFLSDTGSIYHSLKKLSLVKKGFFNKESVEENLFLPLTSTIFVFLDHLARGENKKAFRLLETLIDQGAHPLYILKMIIFEFRNLLMIKSSLQRPESIHPYVFQKLFPLAKIIPLETLKSIYKNLLYYDKRIKEGSIEGRIALEMLLVDFSIQKC